MSHFRKLAHTTEQESLTVRNLRTSIAVMSFMLELAIKYNNEKQIVICRIELERIKNEFEELLGTIFERSGVYPSSGKVEVHRSGDVMEYFRNIE
jgi:hypothetical protein